MESRFTLARQRVVPTPSSVTPSPPPSLFSAIHSLPHHPLFSFHLHLLPLKPFLTFRKFFLHISVSSSGWAEGSRLAEATLVRRLDEQSGYAQAVRKTHLQLVQCLLMPSLSYKRRRSPLSMTHSFFVSHQIPPSHINPNVLPFPAQLAIQYSF